MLLEYWSCLLLTQLISLHAGRARKVLENRTFVDEDRVQQLEEQLKQAKYIAEERELMYEEVCVRIKCMCWLICGH